MEWNKYCHIGEDLDNTLCGQVVDFTMDEQTYRDVIRKGINLTVPFCPECLKALTSDGGN